MTIIGYLVCWCFERPKIKRDTFNEMCRQHGLRYFIPKPKPSPAMSATLDQCRKSLKDKYWHISRIKAIGTKKYYGIYEYERDEEWEDLKIQQVAVMEFDYKTGELTCDWPHPSFERVKNIYNYYCTMVSYSDLIEWSAKMLAATSAVNIRERGGLYFVPCMDEKSIQSFCEIINSIPGKCYADCIPQIDSVELKRVVNRFFCPYVERKMKRYRDWVYPKIKAQLIEDIDSRMHKLHVFHKQLLYYNNLIGFPSDPYHYEIKEFIAKYEERREEVMGLVFTVRQKTQYRHNQKRYEK